MAKSNDKFPTMTDELGNSDGITPFWLRRRLISGALRHDYRPDGSPDYANSSKKRPDNGEYSDGTT